MDTNKYFLTYDFKIIFCQDFTFKQNCKELNSNLEFIDYNGNVDILENYMEITPQDVSFLVNNIMNNKIGTELHEEDMLWIKSFEKIMNEEDLLNCDKLMYNYLILKLQLVGFSEKLACNYVENYYTNKTVLSKEIGVKDFLDNINEKINNKKFWIGNKISEYEDNEIDFIINILKNKNKLKYKFDFLNYRQAYINVIKNSFLDYIVKFNKTKSYLIKEILPSKEFEKYMFYSYQMILNILFENIIFNNFEFKNEPSINSKKFIDKTINDMLETLKSYYSTLN